MKKIVLGLRGHLQELKANKRLQVGGLLIFLMLLVQIGMSWGDRLAGQTEELNRLRAENTTLRRQSQNEASLQEKLAALEALRLEVDQRLWSVSSEAVGQAKVKDWIGETLGRIGIKNPTINIATPSRIAPEKNASKPAPLAEGNLIEFRATINFGFSPESLESCLAEFEGGEPFIGIQSLTVNRQTRQVEMGLHLLMRLQDAEMHSESEVKS